MGNKHYKDLDGRVKARLAQTNLSCVILEDFTDEQADDLFLRLQHGTPLNAAEKGSILETCVTVVKELAKHKIFKSGFVDYKNTRYAFEDSVAKVLHQFICQDHAGFRQGP